MKLKDSSTSMRSVEDEEEDSENSSSDEDMGCAVLDDSDFEDML